MAEFLSIDNFGEDNLLERSELSADVAVGATALGVINDDGMDTDHAVVVGVPGENAEIKTPSAVASNSLTVPAIDFDHKKGEVVYKLRGHKARIYRAANVDGTLPAVGDFSLLTTITLEADNPETEYIDENGGSSYWYLFTRYNDIPGTPEETDKDVESAVRGGNTDHYATAQDVRDESGMSANNFIPISEFVDARDDAEVIIKGTLSKRFTLPLPEVPKILRRITRLLGASFILGGSYGVGEEGTTKESEAKYKKAMALLKQIEDGTIQLIGVADATIGTETEAPSGYPNDDTPDDEGYMFTRDKVF